MFKLYYFHKYINKPKSKDLLQIFEICRTGVCIWWSDWLQLVYGEYYRRHCK